MVKSMTGFGAASGKFDQVEYAVEIRSVNNRYFKANINLPEGWSVAEAEIEKLLRSRISRGAVTLIVRAKLPDAQLAYRVNTTALSNYIAQLKVLQVEADPTFRIDLGSLLQLPGVCQPPSMEELCQRTRDGLIQLITQALEQLLRMRMTEGQALHSEFQDQCGAIEENLSAIAGLAGQVVKNYHQRLAGRVNELTSAGRIRIDEDTLAREVAVFAERCDIAEEMARLKSHIQQFRDALGGEEPCGRKLDFIAQEMLREANTIASKANDTEIGRAVVEMKTIVDRIKEQAQNVE